MSSFSTRMVYRGIKMLPRSRHACTLQLRIFLHAHPLAPPSTIDCDINRNKISRPVHGQSLRPSLTDPDLLSSRYSKCTPIDPRCSVASFILYAVKVAYGRVDLDIVDAGLYMLRGLGKMFKAKSRKYGRRHLFGGAAASMSIACDMKEFRTSREGGNEISVGSA